MRQQEMDKNVVFIIKPHSIIDVITNSSTELFCGVFSKEKLEDIRDFLSNLLDKKLSLYGDFDKDFIVFEIERGGGDEEITSDFIKLLNKILEDNFGKGNFEIRTDVNY
jgi:hypothetical protein